MPNFKFRARDKEGFYKTGTVGGADEEEARKKITGQGLVVMHLAEIDEIESGASTEAPPEPPVPETTPPASKPPILLLGLVLGLVAAAGGIWMALRRPSPERVPSERVTFRLLGNLTARGEQNLRDVEITLDFPEVPYQKVYGWSQVQHPTPGGFAIEVDLQLPRRPGHFIASFRKPQFRPASAGYRSVPAADHPLVLEALSLER